MQLLSTDSTFYALLFPLVRNIVYIIVVTKYIKLSTLQSLLLGVFSLLPTSNIYAYVPIEQRTYSEHVASLLVVIWKLKISDGESILVSSTTKPIVSAE